MRFRFTRLSASVSVLLAILAFPAWAHAQATTTVRGTLHELYVSGSPLGGAALVFSSVKDDGSTIFVRTIGTCGTGSSVNCISGGGPGPWEFNATNVPVGTVSATLTGASWVTQTFSFQSADNINVLGLQRIMALTLELGSIGPSGGSVPLLFTATNRWARPYPSSLNLVARLQLLRMNSNQTNDAKYVPLAELGPVSVPPTFESTGQVVLTTIQVPPNELPGARYCVAGDVYLAGNPNRILANGSTCSEKLP